MIELLQVPHTHALLFVTLVAALLALAAFSAGTRRLDKK